MMLNSNKGFTFLELLLVLFIVSLFCAIVLPKFNKLMAASAASQAQQMADLLVYVNDKAFMSKLENTVLIDFKDKSVSFKDTKKDHKMILSQLSKVILLNGQVDEGTASISVSPWGIQQPVKIFFADHKGEVGVEFNPISAKAVIIE